MKLIRLIKHTFARASNFFRRKFWTSTSRPAPGTTNQTTTTLSTTKNPHRLSRSLYGLGPHSFIATSNYQGISWSENETSEADRSMFMNSELDSRRMIDLAGKLDLALEQNLRYVLDGDLANQILTENLRNFLPVSSPKFVYIGGHATWGGLDFTYLPVDHAEGADGNNACPQGISSWELGRLLVDLTSDSISMMLITDFCYSFNFLSLPYILRRNSRGDLFWDGPPEEPAICTWKPEHRILHFAGGAKGASTHSFPSTGSLFVREFYNVGIGTAVPLSQRVDMIQDGMNKFLGEYNRKKGTNLQQEVQLYSSHKFDLTDPTSLADLFASL